MIEAGRPGGNLITAACPGARTGAVTSRWRARKPRGPPGARARRPGCGPRGRRTLEEPVATARTRAPNARAQRMSCGVSPTTHTRSAGKSTPQWPRARRRAWGPSSLRTSLSSPKAPMGKCSHRPWKPSLACAPRRRLPVSRPWATPGVRSRGRVSPGRREGHERRLSQGSREGRRCSRRHSLPGSPAVSSMPNLEKIWRMIHGSVRPANSIPSSEPDTPKTA